ncbi:site-2 protease family protein [Maridesulfovibrio bastinii]|jgi:Zn-dependent protease|uniref:site-2 protease family protein n=1 Tax=Maridesulfovibrio bastinii TaxID=47157 RepID=UPI0004210436|nr:site-2 protease family protein [Maridesulfovibrio bastinii]
MFDISGIIRNISIVALPFLLAITFHEASHGYVAWLLGDPTAKNSGRLTLNPLKHLDPVGTIALIVTQMIGWAKPVPINPSYFKNPIKGMMLVSIAGPAANFALAVVFTLAYRYLHSLNITQVSEMEMHILKPLALIINAGIMINLALCFFNLIPIPPLDGSKIVAGLLPREMAFKYLSFERYGFIVIILLAFLGLLGKIIYPAVNFSLNLLL